MAQRHLLLLLCLIAMRATAQDPQLSQFYAAPMYLNPALTGNTHQDRVSMNNRLQWLGTGKGYRTYALSYDHRTKSNSSIGGMVMHDRAGAFQLAFTQVSISYAYEARINRRSGFRGGMRLGYTMRSVDPSNLLFADQVIRESSNSIEPMIIDRVSYFDASAGLLYFSEKFWAGVSMSHLNEPQQSLSIAGDVALPMRTSVHSGYRFAVDGRNFRVSETLMTLAMQYKMQAKWDQLDIGGYVEHRNLILGLWYRGLPGIKSYDAGYSNDDAVILMAGFELNNQLQFVYSYDITVSTLTARSGGAHEMSLIYEWPRKGKNRRHRSVPCPKF
ncbi:MAG TPA: type IX secretion system membrane protein PorP/SprF [Flavobacteriales bacterium]